MYLGQSFVTRTICGETIPCLLGLNFLRQIFKTQNEGHWSVTRKELATNVSDWSKSYQQESMKRLWRDWFFWNILTHFYRGLCELHQRHNPNKLFLWHIQGHSVKSTTVWRVFYVSKMIYCKYTNANMYDISSAV